MTLEVQKKIENRFSELKKRFSDSQWSDENLLNAEVDILKPQDIALSFRLMQRVKNLAPTEQNQTKLKKLRIEALMSNPELATVSSRELTPKQTPKETSKLLLNKIRKALAHEKMQKWQNPIVLLVFLPFILFAFYQIVLASPRFESQAKLIIKEPSGMATLDPTMAVMSGFGMSSGSSDTHLIMFFIYSNDMLNYLEKS